MARIIDFFKNLKEKVKRMLQPKRPKVEVSTIEEVTGEQKKTESPPIEKEVSEPEEDLEDKIEEEEKLEQERKKEVADSLLKIRVNLIKNPFLVFYNKIL